jgi:hypothetical protein
MARAPGREGADSRPPNGGGGSGELRSGPAAGTILRPGVSFPQRKPLVYADVDGFAIFEGDIVLGRTEEVARALRTGTSDEQLVQFSIGITGAQFRWPDATVPFEIDPGLPNQQRVTDAIAHWQAMTRIRFVPRAGHADFVRFVPGGGCSSFVGRQSGMQEITLGANCSLGNTIHEMGHAVGLWHEQSREDRDQFVRIVFANIDPAMQHNFTQHIADGDDLGPYDYGSIMHYPRDAFSNNNQDTIIPLQPLPPGVVMGQRNGLSAGDVQGVHAMYPKTPALDPVFTRKELVKDVFSDPTTRKEIVKEPVTDTTTIKEVAKDPIRDTRKEIALDPTIKEGGFDPGPFPGPQPGPFVVQPGVLAGGVGQRPFVLGTPHQAPGMGGAQGYAPGMDAGAALATQVQELAGLIQALDQDRATLAAMLADAAAQLQAMTGGGMA